MSIDEGAAVCTIGRLGGIGADDVLAAEDLTVVARDIGTFRSTNATACWVSVRDIDELFEMRQTVLKAKEERAHVVDPEKATIFYSDDIGRVKVDQR